jgi:hypothetical protein
LIDPELKANYDNNQGQLSKQYERTIAREAKAYVDSYVETLKELKTKVIKSSKRVRGSFNVPSRYDGSDGSDESESSSSSIQHFNTQAWMQFCYVRIPSHQILSRQMIPLMARVLNTWKQAERHLSDPLLQILHIR